MRLVTYLGLVVRRVWAKRGILVGSFLGATLVTALLVIVPLYEDSVRAVDLKFTVRGAPADDVDLQAFVQTTAYDAATAASHREVAETRRREIVAEWYPTMLERLQTREFIVIPVDGAVDWLGRATEWRELNADAIAGGTDPAELAPPYPRPPQEATQVRLFTSPDLPQRLTIVAGQWPDGRVADGDPLPIVIGADLARSIQRQPGDIFALRPFSGQPAVFELVEVAAVVEAVDPGHEIWGIDQPGAMAYLDQSLFDLWTGPIEIDATADQWLRPVRGFTGTAVTQRFILEFDADALDLEEVGTVATAVGNYRAALSRDTGGALAANSFLPNLLQEFDVRSVVVGAPILAMLALVVGGALYFLVYTASLTLEREGPEIALLRTRGAGTWQTVGIHLAQSLLIAIGAALLAPFFARFLVGLTGRVPPLSDLTGGGSLEVKQVRSILPFLWTGAGVAFVSMGLAIIPFARRRVLELRSLAARPTTSSVWQRYNLDLFAIALSLVILWVLSQRGFINFTGDKARLDPLAVVFPVLLLFTGALVLLRVLPWLLRFVGWSMARSRKMSFALPGWHLGRNPVPYGRLALLVWLTTGFGAFALTYANTLNSSFEDRAEFAAGADVRVVDDGAGWLSAPEGTRSAAVLRTDGAPRQSSRRAEVLAVRPDEFAAVVAWRDDFGGPTPASVLAPLRVEPGPLDLGIELPADASRIRIDGVVIPRPAAEKARLGALEPDPSLRLLVRAFDAAGRVWTMQADQDFVDSEWRTVEVDLSAVLGSASTTPAPPLQVHSIWVERSKPTGGNVISGERLLTSGLRAVTPTGEVDLEEALSELSPIHGLGRFPDEPASTARDSFYSDLPAGQAPPTESELAASPLTRDGTAMRWTLPAGRSRSSPAVPQLRKPPVDLRVLLDREAASIAGLDIGASSAFSVGSELIDGTVVGFVEEVPTMVDRRREGRMVLDLDALSAWVNGEATWSFNTNQARVTAPGELWIATDDTDGAVRRVLAQYPPGEEPDRIFSIRASAAQFSSRPVQVGLVSILFVGAATSVALALAGVTGYVLLAVSRRAREMGVLRALGFQRRGVAGTFAVEQFAVLGLGAVIGTGGGIALMRAMIPFLQLGETAEQIDPVVRLDVAWPVLSLYVALVGVLLIASVAWATRRVSARKMSEVLREVER